MSCIRPCYRKTSLVGQLDASSVDLPEIIQHGKRPHPRSDSGTFLGVEPKSGNKNCLKSLLMACISVSMWRTKSGLAHLIRFGSN